jgi:hypothetical protein
MSSSWRCEQHGAVVPLEPAVQPHSSLVHAIAAASTVPVWVPWPLPHGWVITGVVRAGDERTGSVAVAVALSGPAPLGGPGDLVLVAEEPGVGLGAAIAGLDDPDPGPGVWSLPSTAKVHADGHPTPLWAPPVGGDRAVYVGEADGRWLWAVMWPPDAGHLVADDVHLMDVRTHGEGFDLPCGALSPYLPAA